MSPSLILPSQFQLLSYLQSCRKLLYLVVSLSFNSLTKPTVRSHANRLQPHSDPTPNSSRFSRSPPRPARIHSRSNPTTSPTMERYLREYEPHQAFLGRQDPTSPSGSQMPSYPRSYYGPQAPPYEIVPYPYQPSSRGHGGTNIQMSTIPDYPSSDDRWPLPQYPTHNQDPRPTYYTNSPIPTYYTDSHSSQPPPPYESRSQSHPVASYGMLDDPHIPPPYEVSVRSQDMFQYHYDWDRKWQWTEQTREDSDSNDNEHRHSHDERGSSYNERRSNNGERRRRRN